MSATQAEIEQGRRERFEKADARQVQMKRLVSCKNCETLRKEFTDLVVELKATPNGEIEATSRTFIYVTILKKIETILDS